MRETADCSPSGSRSALSWTEHHETKVIYSQAAAAMCHDVGAPLTGGHTVLQRQSNRATQTGTPRKKRGTERAHTQKKTEERLIQRDGKQENEGADEKMERDTDRWGESE